MSHEFKLVWIQLYDLNWLVETRCKDIPQNPFCKLFVGLHVVHATRPFVKTFQETTASPWSSVTSPLVCVKIPALSHFWVCATRWRNKFTMWRNFTPCIFKIFCTSLDSEESLNFIYARYEVVDKNIKMCMYVQNDINIKIHISTPTVTNFWYYTSQLFPNYHICSNILFIFLFCRIVSNALEERSEVTEIIKSNYIIAVRLHYYTPKWG